MNQVIKERRRASKIKERFDSLKREESEKVKNGKRPFFISRKTKKQIQLEER